MKSFDSSLYPSTRPWRKLYKTKAWQTIRDDRKRASNGLCGFCSTIDHPIVGKNCDHITPHKGSEALFFDYENTQWLCDHCHNAFKAQIEAYGYSLRVGLDGLPTDPNHPFNKPRR